MRELRRKFYDYLIEWKSNKGKECLLVKGARQIGKTFIIRKFGRENYESFVEINFIEEPQFVSVFNGNLDADTIFAGLSAIRRDLNIIPGRTLLFLDELQECPDARAAFKFLAEDGRCDVVATGSLLGIKYKYRKRRERMEPRSIPVGYERQATMHSLSLEEFLWAGGITKDVIDYVRGFFLRREKVPDAVNDRFSAMVREYLVVGGMPEVVSDFVEHRHYGRVQSLQEKLVAAYIDDIHRYAEPVDVPKIEGCFRAIPRILAKENRKFKYGEVEKGGTSRKYFSCVEWLKDAWLVSMAECVNEALPGLSAYARDDWFKLYLSDIGLLSSIYGMLVKREVLEGTLVGNLKGGLYENFVAAVLQRSGFPLCYYRNDSEEIEFMIETDDGVVPVEVKARNGRSQSLDRVISRGSVRFGFKFVDGNVGVVGKKITLPHYMAMFLVPAHSRRPAASCTEASTAIPHLPSQSVCQASQ